MSVWDILGIEATGDTSAIKRAYAKKLRLHHPEDDPEGYQRLREAYDSALTMAPYVEPEKDERLDFDEPSAYDRGQTAFSGGELWTGEEKDDYPASGQSPAASDYYREPLHHAREPIPQDPIEQFIDEIDEIYENFQARIDPEAWEDALNRDIVWDVERSGELQYELMDFLEDHRHLPRPVWQRLDDMLHFTENKEDLLGEYPDSLIEYIMSQINGTSELRYECFKEHPAKDIDIEQYLDLREQGQYMLKEGELEEALDDLTRANEIYPHDPDLQLMLGKCHARTGNLTAADECFGQAIRLAPEELDGYWHRAQIRFEQADYSSALSDLEKVLGQEPENTDALCLKGRCYIGLEEIDQARDILKQSNQLENPHIHSYIYLCMASNKHKYGRRHITAADRWRSWRSNLLFDTLMVLRLSWLYILVYLALQVFFDLHPVYTWLLIAVILWNTWKAIKVHWVLAT
ncbi:tetratricopeptide repeat protein [Paenibacillus lactis]|uniref:tetratricopeptide repeat protein n=1 Tax=Paenibacillus lactis TaxID=228574 RepID=UPI0036BF1FCD